MSVFQIVLKYGKNPITPSSAGIVAIMKGVFGPFLYVPLSSFSGDLLSERIESISLFNRGSGILIIALSLISFGLLIKKKYLSSLVLAGISALIVIGEAYWVTVIGVTGRQYSSIHDPTMFLPSGPLVVYDLTVRARLGNALGYFAGGYISYFFAAIMGRNQIGGRKKPSSHRVKNRSLRIFIGIVLLIVVTFALLYIFGITKSPPIVETKFEGFLQR